MTTAPNFGYAPAKELQEDGSPHPSLPKSPLARAYYALFWLAEFRLQPVIASAAKQSLVGILLLFALATVSFADTEVSGAVSGEWTKENSPYIVTDSTWVPVHRLLEIGPGVSVIFQEDQALWVFGVIYAIGTEEDSIRFYSPIELTPGVDNPMVPWQGIFFGDHSQGNRMAYVSNRAAYSGFVVMDHTDLDIDHSLIETRWFTVNQPNPYITTTIKASNSLCVGGYSGVRVYVGNVTIDSCYIYALTSGWPAVECDLGTLTIKSSFLQGDVKADYDCQTVFQRCAFTPVPPDTLAEVAYRGNSSSMTNCFIQANVRGGGDPMLVDSTTIEGRFRSEAYSGLVKNSQVKGPLGLWSPGSIEISNCHLASITSHGMDTLSIMGSQVGGSVYLVDTYAALRVSQCVLENECRIGIADNTDIDNNTFICAHREPHFSPWALRLSGSVVEFRMRNNVFLSAMDSSAVFASIEDEATIPEMKYNLFWGWDSLIYFGYGLWDTLDETNLLVDPKIMSLDPLDPHLQWGSPCIDAGDPDAPLDPDSTRIDIGAFFYPQRVFAIRPELESQRRILPVQICPNPANSIATVRFILPIASQAAVDLFDLTGRRVMCIGDGFMGAGSHAVILDTRILPSQPYLIHLRTPYQSQESLLEVIK